MKEKKMKLNKFANLLVIGLVLTVAASGCRKKPVNVTSSRERGERKDPDTAVPGTRSAGDQPMVPRGPIRDTTSGSQPVMSPTLAEHCIRAGPRTRKPSKPKPSISTFDSSVLKASEKPKVAAVADYLKANSANAVRVEGNCDERGTEEYNRSLGERRALAVREELIRLGIDPTRADTISYGKDKPAVQGHDESAWKQNRRDDFIVLTPPK
jgi:peptidoglycan-associated lipoprotein